MSGTLRIALGRHVRILTPILIGLVFFALNNLTILAGWMNTPAGYVALLANRGQDFAQYLTWMRGFESAWLIPDFHAPWSTEPALFTPLLWSLARICRITAVDPAIGLLLMHLSFHLLAAVGLCRALGAFTETRRQALFAVLAMLCSVPLKSRAVRPGFVITPAVRHKSRVDTHATVTGKALALQSSMYSSAGSVLVLRTSTTIGCVTSEQLIREEAGRCAEAAGVRRSGLGTGELGTFPQANRRIRGGIRDARLYREALCGRMTLEVRVNRVSRIIGLSGFRAGRSSLSLDRPALQ